MSLPPLPPPNYPAERDYDDAWTEDQMRDYAIAVSTPLRDAMERAAIACAHGEARTAQEILNTTLGL